ncbi:MAG TPA: N-acetyl-gamma-glutamyl-phosphate reductase [Myxococcota bacterium]|nr:N-acetyl-gamma-glutamyl-phosphate reductase [Myxococcota bacterium]
MAPKVFIDGQAGTTGLRIRELLGARRDLELIEVDPAQRKQSGARRDCLAAADVAVLCLPDDAAREAVALAAGLRARILDASTAHRVAEGWVYGLPELAPGQREAIARAPRVSNPGCYPTCSTLLLRPLIDASLLAPDTPLSIHALSGYSGGGRAKIERWQDPSLGLARLPYEAPYALDRVHKHVPEMSRHAGLSVDPQFEPAVGPFECGMRVQIPLHARTLAGVSAKQLHEALVARYAGEAFVRVQPIADPLGEDERHFDPEACNGTNRIDLHVVPNPAGHVWLVAIVDNLGKGAAGAAVQNLNLMLGRPEATGLDAG